ncbi:MAG TPA: tRNA (adenosine(37)-N6)-threonylcarbamoyltransferase complex dimerization subunit type 1 TsaB [Candidatus Polarisedimenticolia bacterium]|nr:tRNA (adenosine(37)-N6)-threonylcarbamoyltransferase complex dimerization subunit type 1 TsaB [Candidatus Polarisedimenticolia bacterium]
MPVLGVDTATSRGSLALEEAGRIVAGRILEGRGRHAQDLLAGIDLLLRERHLTPASLTGIGVAVGPGSFTGVRIGMATCKGLAYALNVGLRGLSTLEALARAVLEVAGENAGEVCPVLQAGRGELYAARFRRTAAGAIRQGPDRSWRPADLAAQLGPGCWVAGDGTPDLLEAAGPLADRLHTLEPWPALAPAIALWAGGVIPAGEAYAPGTLGPNYVRPSDAETARRKP